MKKLFIVAAVAVFATSAFAQQGMVELNGCLDNGRCDTLDFNMSGDDVEDQEAKSQTIALNYNHLFTNNFGAGLLYRTHNATTDGDVAAVGDKSNTIGFNFFWNFDGGWESGYAALRYNMTTEDDTDALEDSGNKQTDIVLEAGKRMKLGKAFGLSVLWTPAVSYTMNKETPNNDDADDVNSTELRLNFANFAMTF